MTDSHGGAHGGHEEDGPPVVIRDKRRIDPLTGTARDIPEPTGGGAAASGPGAGQSGQHGAGQPGGPEADLRVIELTEDLQRLKAEFDNYRRRVERDRLAVVEQATAGVLVGLLPVLDDVDRARSHGDLTGAFGAVGEALVALTGKLGLEPYGAPGETFDPNVHEALLQAESTEVTEPVATEVLRPGYRFAGRVLRPAQVVVATPVEAAAEPSGAAGNADLVDVEVVDVDLAPEDGDQPG